jgi:hypothetical protein
MPLPWARWWDQWCTREKTRDVWLVLAGAALAGVAFAKPKGERGFDQSYLPGSRPLRP